MCFLSSFRWDYLARFKQRSGKDFNGFKAFLDGGVRTQYLKSVFPTDSFPTWQSISTGLFYNCKIMWIFGANIDVSFQVIILETMALLPTCFTTANSKGQTGRGCFSTTTTAGWPEMPSGGTKRSLSGLQPQCKALNLPTSFSPGKIWGYPDDQGQVLSGCPPNCNYKEGQKQNFLGCYFQDLFYFC